MEVNFEYVNPFDEKYDYLMRIEHLGRYYFATDLLKGAQTVLDIACADGYGTKILSQSVSSVVGMDKNETYLSIARSNNNGNNITYQCINVDEESIVGNYNGIVCFETLEHLKYPYLFLKNLYEILDEKGLLILSVPNSKYEVIENGKNLDPYHLHVFNYENLVKRIQSTGFIITKIYGQSYINRIVNKEIFDYQLTNVEEDARTIAYPNEVDLEKTYSYIFVLQK